MLMRALFVHIAHEIAGAARIRHSLRPLIGEDANEFEKLGRHASRECETISDVVPAKALGHAHIFEGPSGGYGVEVFEAVLEGDGSGRLGRRVAVPAAEPANDPSGPGKTIRRMWVLEAFASGL